MEVKVMLLEVLCLLKDECGHTDPMVIFGLIGVVIVLGLIFLCFTGEVE
jgi:hypothetical protein